MFRWKDTRVGILFPFCLVGLLFSSLATNAHSVPSFARQTGQDCVMCHMTVFPELAPFGRAFKLGGYVMSRSPKSYEFPPPLAGTVQLSFTNTKKDQTPGLIPENWATHSFSSDNDTVNSPQQASVFYGGRIFDKIGAFIQGTFDGAAKNAFLDNTDIRYANSLTFLKKNLILGVTLRSLGFSKRALPLFRAHERF